MLLGLGSVPLPILDDEVDRFIARLFHIEKEVQELNARTTDDKTVFEFKKRVLDRLVLKAPPVATELAAMNIADVEFRYREHVAEILTRGEWANDPERELAEVVLQLLYRQAIAKTKADASELAHCEENLRDVYAWTRVRTTCWHVYVRRLAPLAVGAMFALGIGLVMGPSVPLRTGVNGATLRSVTFQVAHSAIDLARSTRDVARQLRSTVAG